MDRSNLSNAAIAGMNEELELTVGMRYVSDPAGLSSSETSCKIGRLTTRNLQSIVTLVFFTTYIVFQPPATVLTRKIGPKNFLAGLCVSHNSAKEVFHKMETYCSVHRSPGAP